jgi:hypothetical protein
VTTTGGRGGMKTKEVTSSQNCARYILTDKWAYM